MFVKVDATQIETTCGVKLTETRCGHLCLDAPVIVMNTTQNPCQARYRVIDGAHRLCVLVATMLTGAGTNADRSGRQVHLGSVGLLDGSQHVSSLYSAGRKARRKEETRGAAARPQGDTVPDGTPVACTVRFAAARRTPAAGAALPTSEVSMDSFLAEAARLAGLLV